VLTATVVMILEDDGVTDSYLCTLRVFNRLGDRVKSLTFIPNVFELFTNFGLAM
jgi:hypothetical protein